MIFRKEPLIRKQLALMGLALASLLFLAVLGSLYYVKRLPADGAITPHTFIHWAIIAVLIVVIVNLAWFIAMWKHTISRLEKLSWTLDRAMDGNFPTLTNIDEEGILSRLESQFYRLSHLLQVNLENIMREKENLNALVTDISHQIKTPLASIKVFNSLLIQGDLSQAEVSEFLNLTQQQITRLEWLSASLIKISRLEAGIIELRKEPADIKTTLLDAVNEVYWRALEKGVEINIAPLPCLVVDHDSKSNREAIANILENAIKYGPENGMVNLAVEKLETYIKIDIEDNGMGIPTHELSKVFDRFFRGEANIVKNTEGSGIGLYLSRKIIEQQGGGIIATSTEGQGTRFTILLTL